MAVTMKYTVFWDVMQCGSCKNRSFGGLYRLDHQGDKNRRASNNISSNWQPKHAAIHSTETSVLTRATWRNIPEDGFLH
jgi:hypothetical protein